jgi:Cof subfamily protein (haloacid dehalogenase superfamily)
MTESRPTQPIKLIAIDLDGTLLNTQHEMTERTEKALKAAMAQGVKVIIATGKTLASAKNLMQRLGTNTPGIFNQGTITFNSDGSIHSQQIIDTMLARQVITYAEDRGYLVAAYSGSHIYVRKLSKRMEELTIHFHEPMPEEVGPLQNILDNTKVNKIIAIYPDDARRIAALRWQLSMQVGSGARILSAGIPDELEVLPTNASKGTALKVLLKEFGIPANQAIALGDGENDIEMLQLVGLGIAMGNANDHVKSFAKAVTKSNDEDGVAEAVEKYVLKLAEKPIEAAPTTDTAPKPETVSKVEASPLS